MRLRCSSDRNEIRQQYFPLLWSQLIKRLEVEGKSSIGIIIELMDSYFLTNDDWMAIRELGVGPMEESNVKIDTQTKISFTRTYNQQSHPLPFMKASSVVVPKKASKERPDLEEAIEESDDAEDLIGPEAADDDEEDALDLKKDKYVSAPKKSAAKKAAAKAKGSKSQGADDNEDGEDSEQDIRTNKTKGKSRGGGSGKRGRGKK